LENSNFKNKSLICYGTSGLDLIGLVLARAILRRTPNASLFDKGGLDGGYSLPELRLTQL
jgi:hypothetical protein